MDGWMENCQRQTCKVASWCCGRVSDLRSSGRGSSLSRAPWRKNSGQVSHTYVPLSPSSIAWYRSNGGCLATGEYSLCSVCGWEVKLCDPVVTHGPCLQTSRCCPAWQLIRLILAVRRDRCCVVERFDLTVIKAAYYYYYYYSLAYLSMRKWLVGDIPFYAKSWWILAHSLAKHLFSICFRS